MLRPRVLGLLLGVTIAVAAALPAGADDEPACDQAPGSRFSWVERAFCDLQTHGPDKAHGVIIWNHGISGSTEAWRAPVPSVFRLLQARGWDVLVIKRNNLGETNGDQSLYRAVHWTVQEIRRQRERGYHKIVLAGQSFGAGRWYTTMDDALLAFGLVEGDGGAPRALYRWATSRIGGLVYEATAADGQVTLTLSNKARVTIAPNAGRPTLTWRSADGATVFTAPLLKLSDSR